MADTGKPFEPFEPSAAAELVRKLAGEGLLAEYFQNASADEKRWLRAGAGEIVYPLVFQRSTRRVERKRGHHRCAKGWQWLEGECLDRFHDDVDAVLADLFRRAVHPIENLEGWLSMRIPLAIVDDYRRRRGERGAPQKPRVSAWLAGELGDDPWLVELAKAILGWVGTDATAGTSLWPLSTWAQRRATLTGDHSAGESVVAAEIETVLTAMRRRAGWYEKNVETPLGRRQAAVWSAPRDDAHTEPEPLVLVGLHERDDALLYELADWAIDVMTHRASHGQELRQAVAEVLHEVFGAGPASAEVDRPPGADPVIPDHVTALIEDPAQLDRIVERVVELLRDWDRPDRQ